MLGQTTDSLNTPMNIAIAIHSRLLTTPQPPTDFPTVSTDAAIPSLTPNSSKYTKRGVLYDGKDFTVTMSWHISGNTWDVMLQLDSKSSSLVNPWLGLGLGTGMLKTSQMYVCGAFQQNNTTSVTFREHSSPLSYIPPSISSTKSATGVSGFINTTSFSCSFTRSMSGNPTMVEGPMNFIFAFNPRSGLNFQGIYFTQHQPQHKGILILDLATGAVRQLGANLFIRKQIHGIGMMIVWMVMFPFGAYLARYLRSILSQWLVVKVFNQILGTLFMFMFLYFIVSAEVILAPTKIHNVMGIFMILYVSLQVFVGVLSHMGLRMEFLDQYREYTRKFHFLSGYALLMMGMVQVGLGINLLYPLSDPRDGIVFWVVYFSLIVFWVLLFVMTELYWKHKVYTRVHTSKSSDALNRKVGDTKLGKYTWKSIDEAVNKGAMLVVANGKYVYDMSKWIHSHPGGQIILHTVNGTDITCDYFNESGFDAELFVPQAEAPKRPSVPPPTPYNGLSRADIISVTRRSSVSSLSQIGRVRSITEQDWAKVRKARRTHVHTRLAIERLASMIVGELQHDVEQDLGTLSSKSTLIGDSDVPFSPFEYRRYAVVAQETVDETTMRIKFCLVYPFDIRTKQPKSFLAGQYVELQSKLPTGGRIARSYYPINGDITSFEILLDMKANGLMTQYLARQKPGERQIKIRGPFGTPIVSPHKELYTLETLHFITDGIGIAPLFQFIHSYYLTVGVRIKVLQSYEANLPDELTITQNDQVKIQQHYWDGWCFGINVSTHKSGSFPVGCTAPLLATRIVLHYKGIEPISKNILESMSVSFPQLFQVDLGCKQVPTVATAQNAVVVSGSEALQDQCRASISGKVTFLSI
jgi:hypothetical protein